jgi:hypothetical protein
MNTSKTWISIGICLVFIAGLFAGIVVERKCLYCHTRPREVRREKFSKKDALDRLSKDLSLNSEQRVAIDKIFDKHRPEFEAARKDMGQKLDTLSGRMDVEISNVLNDQQKKKFALHLKERKKHHGEDRH